MSVIIPNAGDTTGGNKYAGLDQAEPDSLDFELLGERLSGVLTGCAVSSNSSSANVAVSAGVVVLNGVPYAVSASPVLSLPAAPADNRFDVVVVRVTAGVPSLTVVQGANSATNPEFPKSASVISGSPSASNIDLSTDVVLAAIYRSGSSTVSESRIVDKRTNVDAIIVRQGATAPVNGSGEVAGTLRLTTGTPSGTASGVHVMQSTGDWVELAQNVGFHLPAGAVVGWPVSASIPSGFLECNGQALATATYPELFAAFGYSFGGSGGTFFMPNFNNKFFRGTTTAGLAGTSVGADSVTLTEANLPSHTHSMTHTHTFAHTHSYQILAEYAGVTDTPESIPLTTDPGGTHSHSVTGNTGAGTPHTHQLASGFNVIAQLLSTGPSGTYIDTVTVPSGTDINWGVFGPSASGLEASHTHPVDLTTSTMSHHTHQLNLPELFVSGGAQNTSTTSGASSSTTGSTGSGTSFSIIPGSTYMRWITRAG